MTQADQVGGPGPPLRGVAVKMGPAPPATTADRSPSALPALREVPVVPGRHPELGPVGTVDPTATSGARPALVVQTCPTDGGDGLLAVVVVRAGEAVNALWVEETDGQVILGVSVGGSPGRRFRPARGWPLRCVAEEAVTIRIGLRRPLAGRSVLNRYR